MMCNEFFDQLQQMQKRRTVFFKALFIIHTMNVHMVFSSAYLDNYFIQILNMGNEMCQGNQQNPGFYDHEKVETQGKEKIVAISGPIEGIEAPAINNQMLAKADAEPGAIGELPLVVVKNKKEEKAFEKISMHSEAKVAKVDYEAMQIVNTNGKRKRINQYELDAPLNIIILTISPGLKHTISQIGKDIFQKYSDKEGEGWRLHKNGFYINYLAKKLTAIFTDNIYFEGELEEDDKIYPKANGILLNETGRYEGSFERGKASGKGTFEDHTKNAYYKGYWKDGKMIEGIIEAAEYRFKGKIQDNIAHGEGDIYFKQGEISYVGKFKKGVYYDKKALYQTKDYVYEGCFVNGMKNGYGALVEKERNYRDKHVKYRPPTQYEGEWAKDIYLNKEEIQAELAQMRLEGEEEGLYMPKVQSFMKGETFEEDNAPETSEKVSRIKADDQLYHSKPKYIWIDPPRSNISKKKSSQKKKEDQGSQIF